MVHDGVLYQRHTESTPRADVWQLLVPLILQKEVLRHCHDNLFGGHLGIAKTVGKIRQRINWYQLRVDVREHVRQCPVCCQNRKQVKPNRAGLGQY